MSRTECREIRPFGKPQNRRLDCNALPRYGLTFFFSHAAISSRNCSFMWMEELPK